jgi:peptide/nickel transport system permease protein
MPDDDLISPSVHGGADPTTTYELAREAGLSAADPSDDPRSTTRRLGPVGWIAAGFLMLLVLIAVVGPTLTADPIVNSSGRVIEGCGDGNGLPLYDPLNCVDRKARIAQRTGEGEGKFTHLVGVDGAGRDVFSQMIVGTRTSLIIAVGAVGAAILVGGLLGLLAGYFRGRTDYWASLTFDVFLAYPALILAIALVSFLGRSVFNITLTVAIVAVPLLGRIARAATLTWSEREFVTAAKALGAKSARIIFREVFPNVLPAMMSIAFLAVGVVIVTEGSLSIIGLGVPDDVVSWGTVLAAGGSNLRDLAHMMAVAAVTITVTVMALNILGDAVRKKFDVRESAL